MYCKFCGKEIDENAYACPYCGRTVEERQQQNQLPNESGATGFGVLSFFFPIVGLILFLVWKTEKPITAKKCGIGALTGFILSFVFGFIMGIVRGLLLS